MADTTGRLSRRKLLTYASYVAGGTLLAGCQIGTAPGASPAAVSPGATGATPKPKVGGTVIVAHRPVGTLENSLNLGTPTPRYLYEIYDRLVNQNLGVDAQTQPIGPGLAESWEVSPDATAYTFKLRQGVKFHDGTAFDAEAVKFNIERLTKKDHPFYYERGAGATSVGWGRVAAVDVVDKSTVRLRLKAPYSMLLELIWRAEYSIASPENIKRLGNDKVGDSPVGTGPFKFVSHDQGVKLVLARNPDYWGGAPLIDQIIVRVMPEPAAAISALLAGEVHLVPDTVDKDIANSLKGNPNVNIQVRKVPGTNNMNFNKRHGVFKDKRVRQAVNWMIDRDSYVRDLLGGYSFPAKSFFAPSSAAYNKDLKGYSYDPEKAKALLREAGVEKGFPITVWAGVDSVPAIFVKDSLAKFGINVTIRNLETATLSSTMNREGTAPGVDGVFWGWNTSPPQNFDRYFPTETIPPKGVNWGLYSNPEVDKLVEQAARTVDEAERVKVYQKAEEIITDDAVWLFMDHGHAPQASVKNLWYVAASEYNYTLRNAHFLDK